MATAEPKAAPDQRVGSWVFGSLLLAFYIAVFVFGPSVLADYKYRMLGVISALLGGLFAYFLTGQMVSNWKADLSGMGPLAIRATGGVGLALALLVWWGNGAGPVQSSSQAATQLQEKVQQAVNNATPGPASSTGSGSGAGRKSAAPSPVPNPATAETPAPAARPAGVSLSPDVQKLAKALAASDPKYKDVGVLQGKKVIPVQTLLRVNNSLVQASKQ